MTILTTFSRNYCIRDQHQLDSGTVALFVRLTSADAALLTKRHTLHRGGVKRQLALMTVHYIDTPEDDDVMMFIH